MSGAVKHLVISSEQLEGYLSIPQWRCRRGHWNDVTSHRCYGCCEKSPPGGAWDWPKEGSRKTEEPRP